MDKNDSAVIDSILHKLLEVKGCKPYHHVKISEQEIRLVV